MAAVDGCADAAECTGGARARGWGGFEVRGQGVCGEGSGIRDQGSGVKGCVVRGRLRGGSHHVVAWGGPTQPSMVSGGRAVRLCILAYLKAARFSELPANPASKLPVTSLRPCE